MIRRQSIDFDFLEGLAKKHNYDVLEDECRVSLSKVNGAGCFLEIIFPDDLTNDAVQVTFGVRREIKGEDVERVQDIARHMKYASERVSQMVHSYNVRMKGAGFESSLNSYVGVPKKSDLRQFHFRCYAEFPDLNSTADARLLTEKLANLLIR